MEDNNNISYLNKDKKLKIYLTIIITIIAVIGGLLGFIRTSDSKVENDSLKDNKKRDVETEQELVREKEALKIDKTAGIIIGLDESKVLTDVVMVVQFNPRDEIIRVISIPRDFYVDFKDPRFALIKEKIGNEKLNYCKLTEVYNNVGNKERALEAIKEIAEQITKIPLNYYVKVDLEGFKSIIDMVGGVEIEVPEEMLDEAWVEDINMDFKEGQYTLDGRKAEQVVRNRYGHVKGDLGRIKMQQIVLKSLGKKIMGMKNPVEIFKLLKESYKYIETDFKLIDGMNYIQYLSDINIETILKEEFMVIIPTTGEKIDGIWYEIQDEEKTKEILDELREM